MVRIGHFFLGGPKRSSEPLAALQLRPVDDTQLPPRLFGEPLISVTFDDGHESIYSIALPLAQKYGIRTTQYVLSGTADNPAYMSWKQIELTQKAGHEIACHSIDHANLTILEDEELGRQLKDCRDELSKRYGPVYHFASPYGAANPHTRAAIAKYYSSHRNTAGDPTNGVDAQDVNVAAHFDRNNIIGFTVRHDTTLEQLQALVAFTKANNGWLVLTYHQADDDTSEYSVTSEDFKRHFTYLSSTDVRIVTVQEALKNAPLKKVEK
jgi:peptidoglycan/xylan/chitin deacetylase (PgdA/CDA1 family)